MGCGGLVLATSVASTHAPATSAGVLPRVVAAHWPGILVVFGDNGGTPLLQLRVVGCGGAGGSILRGLVGCWGVMRGLTGRVTVLRGLAGR